MKCNFFTFPVLCVILSGCATAKEATYYAVAPSQLPNVSRSMKSPGFWISQNPSPDKAILNKDQIKELNASIQNDLKLTMDIFSLSEIIPARSLRLSLENKVKELRGRHLYDETGILWSKDEVSNEHIIAQINANMVPETIQPQYGLVVHYADQRFLPTEKPLYAKAFDVDFDELQNSTLDIGTPVAVLYFSADRQWLYVQASSSEGWVKASNIGLADRQQVMDYALKEPFVVVIAGKADIFLNNDMTKYYDYARMGARFPLSFPAAPSRVKVSIPASDKEGKLEFVSGYLEKAKVNQGYLMYTPRTIINQAFGLLNASYGWGGMYGEQDCSAFLQEVFSTVGILLPRDSKDQALVGKSLAQFDETIASGEKIQALQEAPGGVTILPMKGHIMLYLGMVDNRPYAIHATWAYRAPNGKEDRVMVVNRVVVSDLSLGEGSRKGSLLKRLMAVKETR